MKHHRNRVVNWVEFLLGMYEADPSGFNGERLIWNQYEGEMTRLLEVTGLNPFGDGFGIQIETKILGQSSVAGIPKVQRKAFLTLYTDCCTPKDPAFIPHWFLTKSGSCLWLSKSTLS